MLYHAGSCISHDLADLFPHLRLIAMDRTVAAGCLVFLKRTVLQPEACVFNKFPAFVADFPLGMMMVPAVDADHVLYGLLLSFHAGMQDGCVFSHAQSEICLEGYDKMSLPATAGSTPKLLAISLQLLPFILY
jgi:hypothetical protein